MLGIGVGSYMLKKEGKKIVLRIKPNLSLVNNDCFDNDIAPCDYRCDISFEELIEALLYCRYGKVAFNPNQYAEEDVVIIRKMAERNFIKLLEFT